ncbi:MAG: hypothetical protein HY272_11975 [Gammaproteobacteria bacterium]|nr:hypothetical protein [Gammaproteobacteria bacterium]
MKLQHHFNMTPIHGLIKGDLQNDFTGCTLLKILEVIRLVSPRALPPAIPQAGLKALQPAPLVAHPPAVHSPAAPAGNQVEFRDEVVASLSSFFPPLAVLSWP